MKTPIVSILERYEFEPWSEKSTQFEIRQEILALGIDGIVDVKFSITDNGRIVRVTPVFATEQDWMWYNLKYEPL